MSEKTEYVKFPTFDGKDENWPFFKKKMESYLARIDVAELLSGDIEIPLDSDTDDDEDALEEINRIRMKNRKAAILGRHTPSQSVTNQ